MPFPNARDPLPFARSLWALCRVIRRHRIQLIHSNEQDVYPIAKLAGRICRIPVVVSVHFTLPPGFTQWAFGGKRQPERMIFTSRGNLEASRAAVTGVIDASRWCVIYNGLDLTRFQPDERLRREFRERHQIGDAVAIGVACALRPRKQLEHLFEAAARLDRPDLKVVVAGGPVAGDEAYVEHLLAAAKSKLGSRLVLLGHQDELRGLYNGLDIFVNTSQEEACSLAVMEALACGLPVLGYASKSVDDQILPEGGEIVAQDDIAALTDRLDAWSKDRAGLPARRRGARARAELMFDIRKVSDELWAEYGRLLDATSRGAA